MRMSLTWMLAALMAAAGCGSGKPTAGAKELRPVSGTPPSPVERADAIDLWAAPPAAINWDDVPGPDGVRVSAFLYRADRAEPVLVKGTLEFLMFEGRVQRDGLTSARPVRVWSYTSQELGTRQMRGVPGWGYGAQLGWGRDVPTSAVVTVAVRYRSPTGEMVYSSPISIAMPSVVRSGPISTTLGGPPKEGGPGTSSGPIRLAPPRP